MPEMRRLRDAACDFWIAVRLSFRTARHVRSWYTNVGDTSVNGSPGAREWLRGTHSADLSEDGVMTYTAGRGVLREEELWSTCPQPT